MTGFFSIMMILAALSTLSILGLGLFSMVKGGEFNKKHGNRLMQLRVTLQGLTFLFFALAFMTSK